MSHLPPSYNPPPLPPPLPVQAMGLPYTLPSTNDRPGTITAIGVTSICLGGIGMIWGLFASFMTFALFAASTGMGQYKPPTPDMAGPNGFHVTDRQVAVRALNLKQSLTQAQQDQLNWFLADVGTTYFPQVPAPSKGSDVAADYGDANVTESDTEVEGGKRNYVITMGKVTVTDTEASITLADGTKITRSTIRQMPNPADPSQLSQQEVGALVSRIQEMSSTTPLTAAQLATLSREIQTSSAMLIGTPTDLPAMMMQINSVTNNAGNAFIQFQNGIIILPTTGPATTSAQNMTATARVNTGPKMLPTPSVMLIIESVLSIGLAIYLLVIGIVTLRSSPLGSRLHKIYAWLKILLTLVGAGALAWLIVGGGGTTAWATIWGFMMLVAGVLYSVILLCVLRVKSVREWYTAEPA